MYFLVLFITWLDTSQKMGLQNLQAEVKVLKEELKSAVKEKDGIMIYSTFLYVQFSKTTFLRNYFEWTQLHIQCYQSIQYLGIKIDRLAEHHVCIYSSAS